MSVFFDNLISGSNHPGDGFVEFISSDHIRYQNGVNVSGHNYDCHRKVRIEKSITDDEGYTVTIFNEDAIHPVWRNNVQMSPKKMHIVKVTAECIELRGFGFDQMGFPFNNYGMSVYFHENKIVKCVLHMFDRGITLEYLE